MPRGTAGARSGTAAQAAYQGLTISSNLAVRAVAMITQCSPASGSARDAGNPVAVALCGHHTRPSVAAHADAMADLRPRPRARSRGAEVLEIPGPETQPLHI
jgi:hypothetical protein